jgi:hypothetical protein
LVQGSLGSKRLAIWSEKNKSACGPILDFDSF